MQVGSVAAIGPKNQSALKLISDIVEQSRSAQTNSPSSDKPWSTATAASSVSSRSASAIQDLVKGNATGMTTFKRLGGPDQTLPTDEYDFFARNIAQTLDQVADEFIKTQLNAYPQFINQALDAGRVDDANEYSKYYEALKRSLANGTFKIELLDDRVAGDYRWYGVRDSEGNVGGMKADMITPLDWNAFYKVYGNGKGGYDRYNFVGGNPFIRQYVISLEK